MRIHELAAKESETGVDEAPHHVLNSDEPLSTALVEALVKAERQLPSPRQVRICPVCLTDYDLLLCEEA